MSPITQRDVDADIVSVDYYRVPDTTCTVCTIVMSNGFAVCGLSQFIDPSDYSVGAGESVAYSSAESQVREYLAFRALDNRK